MNNYFSKKFIALTTIALASGFFAYTNSAFAADATVATIPEDKIDSWRGNFNLPAQSVVRREPSTVPGLINSYLGKSSSKFQQEQTFIYNPEGVYRWLQEVAAGISTTPQEPSLTIEDGRATNFNPPQDGQRVNLYQTTLNVLRTLELGGKEVALIATNTAPRTSLAETNNLGITELVARGESSFKGSPKNRRHNIAIGVSKMRGVILAPGEEFSFNEFLGPVEAYAGFLPELVIRRDKGTVPELGGGLCQVSSTTFRAAMEAGLPITQRRNHSYAVQYYAPQGTDATIYPGVQDLKFVNNTPGSILIWPYFEDGDKLVFDFYGTKDNREVVLDKPYTYDRKSDGSMKASWTRTVKNNGKEDKVTFNSVYLPPALFHKQEEFVTNPTSPDPTQTVPPTPAPTTTPDPGTGTGTPTEPEAPSNAAPTNTTPSNNS